jgi:hypothetical protein
LSPLVTETIIQVAEKYADEIEQLIRNNDSTQVNQWGEKIGHGFSIDTIYEFRKALDHLRYARAYVRRIDYLLSGDDGEDSFQKFLEHDVAMTTLGMRLGN